MHVVTCAYILIHLGYPGSGRQGVAEFVQALWGCVHHKSECRLAPMLPLPRSKDSDGQAPRDRGCFDLSVTFLPVPPAEQLVR